jgi:ribosomal protein L40E
MRRESAVVVILLLSFVILHTSMTAMAHSSLGKQSPTLPMMSPLVYKTAVANETLLSIGVSSAEVSVGDTVVISGTLVEQATLAPIFNATVIIWLTCTEAGLSESLTVRTETAGNFTHSYLVSQVGNYTVRAGYSGDASHQAAVDAYTGFKARLAVMLDLRTETIVISRDLFFGSTLVNMTGSTNPPVPGIVIRIEVSGATPQYVLTGPDGVFLYSFTPPADGDYDVIAYYDGDAQHSSARSTAVKVSVHTDYTTLIIVLVAVVVVLGVGYWRGFGLRRGRRGPPIAPPPGVICPSCGSRARPGATFCKRCGASLRAGTATVCPRCRASNKPTAGFCRVCGTKLR